ncbi:MAG: DUF721 domain-containing protein [Muribaculaceae bacterium]|nr:DUF721 domain-containing protein [Muribaculaceae bacterium]
MKRTYPKQVGDIIGDLLRKENLEQEWDEHCVLDIWGEIVGPGINRYTVNRAISKGVLTVWLTSAPLRNELSLNRSLLIKRINEAIGKDIVTNIIFR